MSVANRTLCPGYPPYSCTTLIDPAKPSGLCEFCTRTREIERGERQLRRESPYHDVERPLFGQHPDAMQPIVEVVRVIEKEIIPTCACGGMVDGPDHEKSLLHRQYLLSQQPERPTAHYRTHWPKGANQ